MRRGRREVFDGLSVRIPRGQVIGLLGPSGCGKTTLMRSIVGVHVIDGGTVTALGLLASAFAQTEFQAVQFMPLLVFPQVILGGLFMPREQMPDVLEVISDWLPLSYAVDAINAVAKGDDAWDVGAPLLIVGAFAVGCLVLAPLTLRRRTP